MNGSSDVCLQLRADGEAPPHNAPAGLSGWGLMMRRRRSRQELLALDADQLRDIGLTREQALVEGHRPFWKP
ncbi:DUF1127 domain-containing protein [Pseudomonas sp. MAFF212428]|uniref:DUF1127 domain-containing protein n=1 Tax=Pseudomonas brassicae TaxID=2708063 RepID=A0A6B3NVA9_9PSED|nr:DUF1127 domain-containing protein [Pseudomonas brassicae]NER60288.1 DUF1127 domain-containing protein [Pseudomonas brassicae]NER63314.1 DUF1127 domain-containing protein [Pseudomonas brassicae]